jgi:hypothetical protein
VAFINKDIELRILLSSFASSKPLLFRIHQKFKAQVRVTHLLARVTHMPVRILTIDIYDSHTQSDKIDRLVYIKIIISTTIYYSLLWL